MISFGIKDVIDILLVAFLLYYIYRLMKRSSAANIFTGIIIFILCCSRKRFAVSFLQLARAVPDFRSPVFSVRGAMIRIVKNISQLSWPVKT